MAIAAAPAAVSVGRAAAGKAAGKKAAAKGAGAAGGGGGGSKLAQAAGGDLPERGSWKKRAQDPGGGGSKKKSGGGSKLLKGAGGSYRKWLIAEFLICVILLGLSPLAKKPGEMGPIRFMKRGSATCAFFIILGMVSAGGKGAAKAAAMFGFLVTLVLLVDQREAFGKLAKTLNSTPEDEAADAAAANDQLGPDDSTDSDDAGVAQV
ncbi:hypothetical protein ACIRD9_42535 [Streptomyces violaceus]|uniref:hypothetical protein n=1 Tax=Streptomyces violaceus TaxID=1936 RepID=UPI003824CA23